MSNELKPCPFCGSKGKPFIAQNHLWVVFCSDTLKCPTRTNYFETKQAAIEKWNTRTQPTIADYLKAKDPALTKTKAKMVSIESLKEFAGIKDSDND